MESRMRAVYHLLVGSLAFAIAVALAAAWIWPVVSAVETGQTAAHADLVPQYYSTDPVRVVDESQASLVAVAGVDAQAPVEQEGAVWTVEATVAGPVGLLDASFSVRVRPVTDFVTEVSVRSETPDLPGDLGQNRRNIERFFAELDARLGAVRFNPQQAREGGTLVVQ